GSGWSSVLDALPGTLLVPGVYLLTLKRRRLKKLGRVVVVVKQRRWLVGSVLCAVAVIALVRGWPFAVDPYPPYRDLGLGPHQDLIDYVDRLGGATVWSFPEARDAGEQWMGPVKVSWYTPPYPDDLMRTARYTAFGAVYEDTTRLDRPGGSWDRLLGQFAAGDRSRPAWAVGESGFHGFTAGKSLGKVRSVFLVEERTERALVDALKRGRLYAVEQEGGAELVLAEFSVRTGASTGVSGDVAINVPIHKPHYLPWLGYFAKWAAAAVFVVLDTVQYDKNGWQNRNRIKTSEGPRWLTVPVNARLGTAIHAVTVDTSQPWR